MVSAQTTMPVSRHFTVQELTDGVYAAIHNDAGGYAICNAGIIDLGDKTMVIDPFFTPAAARDLKKIAEHLTGREVEYVINTHYHNDHTRGNQVFDNDADIFATKEARDHMERTFYTEIEEEKKTVTGQLQKVSDNVKVAQGKALVEAQMWYGYYKGMHESFDELRMSLPNKVVQSNMSIKGSKRSVALIRKDGGHTDGDLLVWLPGEQIIFMGDQLFVRRHPFLGEGDLEQLKHNLDWVYHLNPDQCVPGHGPVGSKEDIRTMQGYIRYIQNEVTELVASGAKVEDVAHLNIPDRYEDWLLSRFWTINLQILFAREMQN